MLFYKSLNVSFNTHTITHRHFSDQKYLGEVGHAAPVVVVQQVEVLPVQIHSGGGSGFVPALQTSLVDQHLHFTLQASTNTELC